MYRLDLRAGPIALLVLVAPFGCGYGGNNGRSAMTIWEAVEQEDLAAIESYARSGKDLDVGAISPGKTPLLYALILKKKGSYTKLLALGANPNTICRGEGAMANSSVVHHAAREGDPSWLRAALESRGDPNQVNGAKGLSMGRPLYFAIVGKGGIEHVKQLCEHGADINAPIDHLGRTALYQAAQYNKFDVLQYLLERGADVSEPRPVHELNTFIYTMRRQKRPDYMTNPNEREACTVVWVWLKSQGRDPEAAKWNGSKWTWEGDR